MNIKQSSTYLFGLIYQTTRSLLSEEDNADEYERWIKKNVEVVVACI